MAYLKENLTVVGLEKVSDPTDPTKQITLVPAGNSTGVLTTIAGAQTTSKVYTLQDVAASNFVMSEGTQTVNGAKTFGTVPTLPVQNANKAFMGPVSGSDAAPAFRALVTEDIPSSDNLANVWGDCEAALLAETRTSPTDTTARTLRYWAYDNGQSAPAATATELFGTQSYEASMTEIGEFLETPLFAIPLGYVGKALNVSFLLNTGAATATTDYTIKVIRYNSSRVYQETITCQGSNFLGIGTWTGFFISGSTSTDLYSIMVYSNVAPTIVFTVDQFYVGQKSLAVGFGGTDSQEMTQVLTPGTSGSITNNASYKTTYFVHGNILFMNVVAIVSSVSSPVGTVLIQLPSGYTVKKGTTSFGRVGTGLYYDDSASAGSKYIEIAASYSASTPAGYVEIGSNDESLAIPTPAAGDSVQIELAIPINETTSGITMLNSDRVKSVVKYNVAATQGIGNSLEIVNFDSKVYDTKSEVTTGAAWKFQPKSPGYYRAYTRLNFVAYNAWALTDILECSFYLNNALNARLSYSSTFEGNVYAQVLGECVVYMNGTTDYLDLRVGQNADAGDINLSTSETGNCFIAIEQLTDRDSLAGLPISTANVIGRTDGVAIPAGFLGEYRESIGSSTGLTSGAWSDAGASGLLLTPGIYDLQATGKFDPAASTRISKVTIGIGTVTGNDSTGIDYSRNATRISQLLAAPTNQGGTYIASPLFRITVAANTTYFPKLYSEFDTSTLNGLGFISARRVA